MRFLPLLLLPSVASAAIIHVDSTAAPGGDGSSPAQAFEFLQDALAAAAPKDVIHVGAGVYFPSKVADPTESFVIPNFVTVIGGFKAGFTNDPPSPDDFPTILSGDIGKDDTDPDSDNIIASSGDQVGVNSEHVVTVTGATDVVVLQGLVITAGDADGATNNHAGGLLATGSNLQIDNCWFRGNQGGGRGGALHLDDCNAEVVNCDFAGNKSVERGGAVGTVSGTDADFINCLVRGNESKRGAGFNFNDSTGLLLNCTVSGNNGTVNGGGIQAANSATVTVTDSIIWRNLAAGARFASGSSYNAISGSSITPSATSIIENVSGSDPDFVSEFDPANAPDTGGNHRLSRGSPGIHAGPATTPNDSGVDQAGLPRIVGLRIDLGAFEAPAYNVYVDDTAGGANNGSSWTNAFTSLEAALTAALRGDQVLVAEGVYTPATEAHSFEIPEDVAIYGGYPDGGGTRDPDANPTILSGDVTGNDQNLDGNSIAEDPGDIVLPNCSTIARPASGATLTPLNVIDGLIFTAGRAMEDFATGIDDSHGGALVLRTAVNHRPLLRDCTFIGNRALTLGGAVYVNGVLSTFEDCSFIANWSDGEGGGLGTKGGVTLVENCVFTANEAPGGAAIANRAPPSGDMTVTSTRIQANTNGGSGSAVLIGANSDATFINCLLTGNEDNAVEMEGDLDMHGCTISGNGGSPLRKTLLTPILNVHNSIFWNNDSPYFNTGGNISQFHHSLVQGWSDTSPGFSDRGNLDGTDPGNNPLFAAPEAPASAPTTSGDYHLDFSSPAMSIGDNTETESSTDLDGNPRISGHSVDLGCYEFVLSDADGDGLSDAFELANTSPASTTSLSPTSDLDHDGMTALEEFAFGTDPNSPNGTAGSYYFDWFTSPDRLSLFWTPDATAYHYVRITPETSEDLGISDPWNEVPVLPGNSPGEFRADTPTFPPVPDRQFLRLHFEN